VTVAPAALAALLTLSAGPAGAGGGDLKGELLVIARTVGSQVAGPEEAVVFLADAPAGAPAPARAYAVEQVGKAFVPRVLVVPQGATVAFPNRDLLHHNIFSLSPARPFDLGLYEPGATRSVTFDRPGVVALYCNIHPQMLGHVVVVSNPHHTRPAADGSFTLRNVPPGTYQLVAWFPFGREVRQEVKVAAGKVTSARLVLRERADANRHSRKDGSPYSSY
jgi:plastocyanin